MSLFVIWSVAYCDHSLVPELGRIPAAFVPMSGGRLFEAQCGAVPRTNGTRLILAVPDDYYVDSFDRDALASLGVQLAPVPATHGFVESLLVFVSAAGTSDEELRVLPGAELLRGIPYGSTDLIALFTGMTCPDGGSGPAATARSNRGIAGDALDRAYFSFSSSALLLQCLQAADGSFPDAVAAYNRLRPLRQLHVRSERRGPESDVGWQIATPRSFNDVRVMRNTVRKSSERKDKLLAEASWYSRIPVELASYVPRLIRFGHDLHTAWYETEYIPRAPLSSAYVFGWHSETPWRSVFRACDEWLTACSSFRPRSTECDLQTMDLLYAQKTFKRLERFASSTGTSLVAGWSLNGVSLPSLQRIALDAVMAVPSPSTADLCIVHGDLCFSNILYDFETQSLRLIDPRGLDGKGRQTIYGDQRYDIAKLYHSVVGLYDFIIAGRYHLKFHTRNQVQFELPRCRQVADVQALFFEMSFNGHTALTAASLPVSILLFLSMLPLHSDAPVRQQALLANALRLYSHMVTGAP
jgi:hypothetical protein